MQTTEIKYAIMDRVTGKLLTYYSSPNGVYYIDNDQTLSTWYVEDIETAYSVMDGYSLIETYGSYKDPTKTDNINISPASHCVVKVTMVCTVEIVE